MNVKLALEVKKRVLAEPKKVFMGDWIRKITKAVQKEHGDYKYLACSTVGCIAGHTVMVALTPKMVEEAMSNDEMSVEEIAAGLLGLDKLNAKKLFFFHDGDTIYHEGDYLPNDEYRDEFEALQNFKPGTRDYARVVARAIDKCIELNN